MKGRQGMMMCNSNMYIFFTSQMQSIVGQTCNSTNVRCRLVSNCSVDCAAHRALSNALCLSCWSEDLKKFFPHFVHVFSIFFLNQRNSITIKSMNLNLCMWKRIITYWGIEYNFSVNLCSSCATDRYLSLQCTMNEDN